MGAVDDAVEHANISVDYTGRGDPSELFPFSPPQDSVESLRNPNATVGRPRSEAPESVPVGPKPL